jgi:hypothetical protein
MKLFGGERLGGGKASRAEVYGLFIAAIVLTGGGIGGAYAISASLGSSEQTITDALQDSNEETTSDAPQDSNEETTSDAPQDSNEETTPDAPQDSSQSPSPVPSGQTTPASSPPAGDGLIKEPYIGPANTFSYLSRGHICGWDTQALGGFGWGFDPTEPCNSLFVDYVGKHCEADDGVVYFQRCDEYFSRTLPVAY